MIHLLHGIHTEGLEGPVQVLRPYLPWPCAYPDYGWIAALETRRINPAVIGALLPYVHEDDVLIGHSNGCAIAAQVAQKIPVRGLVLINAALKSDVSLPTWVQFIQVYSNEGDDITELAEFEADLPASPVDPIWGKMGHSGYTGSDARFSNTYCDRFVGMPHCWGHSDIATPENAKMWMPYIKDKLALKM